MKPLKMLGLAALAALLAMAFVGVSSAMAEATYLCTAEEEACEETVTHVHETSLSGHKAILLSSLKVECDVLFLGDTQGESGIGAPLVISGAFTYSNCEGGCTAEEENSPSEIIVLAEGEELTKVTSGTGAGAGLVHLVCSGFINCRYTGSGLVGHGLGPLTSSETNGSVTLSEQEVKKESGSLCPEKGKLDITTTPLEQIFVGRLQMVCIDVGANNGLFLGTGNGTGTCQTSDSPNYTGRYELGWARRGTGLNAMTCAWVGRNRGFWLRLSLFFSSECATKDTTRSGEYELGVTV